MLLFLGTLAVAPLVAGTFDALAQAAVTGVILCAALLYQAGRRVGVHASASRPPWTARCSSSSRPRWRRSPSP
jgi:hypothetical protein